MPIASKQEEFQKKKFQYIHRKYIKTEVNISEANRCQTIRGFQCQCLSQNEQRHCCSELTKHVQRSPHGAPINNISVRKIIIEPMFTLFRCEMRYVHLQRGGGCKPHNKLKKEQLL